MATLMTMCAAPQESKASHWGWHGGYHGYYHGPRWPAYSYSYGWGWPAYSYSYRYGWPAYSYSYGWPAYSYSYGWPTNSYYGPRVYYSAPTVYYSPPVYYSTSVPTVRYSQSPGQYVSSAPTTRTVDVEAYADTFLPKTVHVSTGTTVRWINYSGRTHTVTGSDGKWGSGDLLSGESYTVTFDRPGTYQYYCRHHDKMQGTVVVNGAAVARSDY